jgi:hypothetical protein
MDVRCCCRQRAAMLPALLPTTGGDATGVAADDGRRCYRHCCRRLAALFPWVYDVADDGTRRCYHGMDNDGASPEPDGGQGQASSEPNSSQGPMATSSGRTCALTAGEYGACFFYKEWVDFPYAWVAQLNTCRAAKAEDRKPRSPGEAQRFPIVDYDRPQIEPYASL